MKNMVSNEKHFFYLPLMAANYDKSCVFLTAILFIAYVYYVWEQQQTKQ